MTRKELLNRIVVNPNVLVGKPVIRGTRISIEFIVDLLAQGWTTERILAEYQHLEPEDIQACVAYSGEVHRREELFRKMENFALRKGITEADVIAAVRKRRKRR